MDARQGKMSETTPLLPGNNEISPRSKSSRNVTFSDDPVTLTIEPDELPPPRSLPQQQQQQQQHLHVAGAAPAGAQPILSAFNSKLRRRNSHGTLPAASSLPLVGSKLGPQRSTKKTEKLKLLPNPELEAGGSDDEENGRDVYSQLPRIKDPSARRDAARLGKADRGRLPRVTAYCTANRYDMEALLRFLKGRGRTRNANPKLIDECIYTPYRYTKNIGGGGGGGGGSSNVSSSSVPKPALTTRASAPTPTPTSSTLTSTSTSTSTSTAAPRRPDPVQTYERRHSTGGDSVDENNDNNNSQQQQIRESLIKSQDQQQSTGGEEGEGEGGGEGVGAPAEDDNADVDVGPLNGGELLGPSIVDGVDGVDGGGPAIAVSIPDFDTSVHTPEAFLFDYGVVVLWGMTESQETRFLKEISKFELEKLSPDDVETEHFNFYYTKEYQARIYNDFITLRDKNNYMIKLAISHALAQSVKTSLFEELIASTVETCKDIPTQIALTGKIDLSRSQINMQIGELFILRISIHLNGSVLDTPELFWVEPQLEPVYQAVRSYLEMDQRVGLLNERLDVIADLLAVLKDQLSHGHGEKLEWIVIVLIAAEILVAFVNIVVDLYAGE